MTKINQYKWWQEGVVYHIYPLSFYDSNNDGKGDIKGICEKLDYLENLGVNAIWLSPVYKSPMLDFGYDVENYREIDPAFGTLEDIKKLIQNAHNRGIRIIMDMILNHTSDKHPWFLESKSSRENPKRDWYIWKDSKKKKFPNNWKSALGGSVWEYDKTTSQYYLHTFLPEQPDLNWENEEMQKTFFEDIRFWLELGVDGFRLDVINMIGKDSQFRNNPAILGVINFHRRWYSRNQPLSYEIIARLRKLIDEYNDRVLIGEIYALPFGNPKLAASYLGKNRNGLHLAFDFSIVFRYWSARQFYKCFSKWYSNIPDSEWPSVVFSNHDLNRSYNRPFTGNHLYQKAIIKAFLLLTLKGTPFIYYGDEIGMRNSKLKKSQLKDPIGKKYWPLYSGRDVSRTPMQWNDSENAGFSEFNPWLPVDRNFQTCNVTLQQETKQSLWYYYFELIKLRKFYRSLQTGEMNHIFSGKNGVWSFARVLEKEVILVAINFTARKKKINILLNGEVLLSTHKSSRQKINFDTILLEPYEASVILKR